jgi:hypothetical protein
MNTPQEDFCVSVLGSVVWADGQVSEMEMDKMVDVIGQMEYADRPRLQEILLSPQYPPRASDLAGLERGLRIRLLHDAYIVADHCSGLEEAELAIVRTIAQSILPDASWDDVRACLEAYAAYQRKAQSLFGLTHLR